MTSPGGRIEIRVDPDLRGFGTRLSSGLTDSARTGVAAFASAAKVALLGAAVGIGAAGIVAAKSTLNIGIEYQNQLNTLQAVSGATEAQMKSVGVTAKALGQDLTLPATSAADAAAVMTELAKANFTVDDAQKAAKGSLQLATAAQIDGARAATIQANAINAFGLAATDATRVADVLANAANASSAEITDVADALAQASAVAASAHISIEDTATVIGLLANNGIKGSDAGTLLKSALLALQSPSKQARQAMDALNLTAYDQQGNFVGLKSIFEQLQVAQGSMTQQQYEMATSTLFGSDAARLAGIAAKEGGAGFDKMSAAIGRQGAAADVAAAKSKGLGGAIAAFKSQVETVQIDVFERAAPSLERLVRAAAARLPEVAASALDTADHVVAAFQDMAPRIGKALDARRDTVVAAWHQLGEPLIAGAKDLADKGLDVVVHSAERLGELAGQAIDTVEPLAKSVGNFASSLAKAGGPLDTVDKGLDLLASAANLALDVLGPFVRLAGNAVNVISGLPGPLESAVVGLIALKAASNIDFFSARGAAAVSGVGTAVKTTASSFKSLSGEMAVQGALFAAGARDAEFAASGADKLGRSFAMASVSADTANSSFSRVQMMQRGWDLELAGTATATEKASGSLSRLGSAGATVAARGLSAAKTAGAGLVSLLGGPWGVAITGAVLGIGAFNAMIARHDAEIKKATADVTTWYKTLALGGSTGDVIKAQQHLDGLRAKIAGIKQEMDALENSGTAGGGGSGRFGAALPEANRLEALRGQYGLLHGELTKGEAAWKQQLAAMTPVELATARVQAAQDRLNEALKHNPATSMIVIDAESKLATAQHNLAAETDGATRSQQTQIQAMQASATAALAQIDAQRALEQAQLGLSDAIARYNEDVASGTLSATALRQEQLSLVDTAESVATAAANAAAKQAEQNGATDTGAASQAAFIQSLQATADQLNGPAKQAVLDMIAALGATQSQAFITAGAVNQLGITVVGLPNDKTVEINVPTDDQMKKLHDLGYVTVTLPNGHVLVTADTNPAQTEILGLLSWARTQSIMIRATLPDLNGSVSGSGRPGMATGGYIRGPGTGTSDSIPIWASNGEYMIKAAVTARSRSGLDAVNRGDWAAAAREFSALADRQSRASIAALAGSQAARSAGRFAAGGYVDAQDRLRTAVTSQPVPVPVGDVVGAQYNGPVYLVDPEEQARQSRRAMRAALAAAGLR